MKPIRLLIVDDHPVVRDGLRGMFDRSPEFEVAGEAADGAEAIALADKLAPDVILMDLHMPGVDGVSAIREIVARRMPSRILVLTTYDMDIDVLNALEAGAQGYLLKDAPREEVARAVQAVARGEAVLSPSIASRLIQGVRKPAQGSLSSRELEILKMVAGGAANRDIAEALFISEATVKTHLLHIYEKLGVRDRAAAVGEGYRRGILQ